jgi:hypothetical protein
VKEPIKRALGATIDAKLTSIVKARISGRLFQRWQRMEAYSRLDTSRLGEVSLPGVTSVTPGFIFNISAAYRVMGFKGTSFRSSSG